jgi:hypothetical protein
MARRARPREYGFPADAIPACAGGRIRFDQLDAVGGVAGGQKPRRALPRKFITRIEQALPSGGIDLAGDYLAVFNHIQQRRNSRLSCQQTVQYGTT